MAIVRSKYKLSRRLGKAVWGGTKDPVSRGRIHPPGMHGVLQGANRRTSDYGGQLHAKQLLKGYYGNLKEKQFVNIFKKASKRKGDTAQNLIRILESRLTAIVYRANFVPTVFAAKQLVSHKHFTVNGKVVNVGNCCLKIGDVISVAESSRSIGVIVDATESQSRPIPSYLELSDDKMSITFVRMPDVEEVPFPVDIELRSIIEFYSR